jgi:hypothetical protein
MADQHVVIRMPRRIPQDAVAQRAAVTTLRPQSQDQRAVRLERGGTDACLRVPQQGKQKQGQQASGQGRHLSSSPDPVRVTSLEPWASLGHVAGMERIHVTVLDMNADGTFRTPQRPSLAARIGQVAIIVAVLAMLVALASFAVFAFAIAIPVAAGAALVAWAATRFRAWRAGSSIRPLA